MYLQVLPSDDSASAQRVCERLDARSCSGADGRQTLEVFSNRESLSLSLSLSPLSFPPPLSKKTRVLIDFLN